MKQISVGLLMPGGSHQAKSGGKKNQWQTLSTTRRIIATSSPSRAIYYKIADGVITFIHTEVPPELGGKGVGSALVKGALDQVRADGLTVIAECPFVKAYIDKHGEYADLLKH